MEIKIESDVFDITKRLKEIDNSYYVIFNTMKQKFEVHSSNQILTSYCFTIPFDSLDKRTIDLTNKTRVVNKQKLFDEMERQNEIFEKNRVSDLKRRMYEC